MPSLTFGIHGFTRREVGVLITLFSRSAPTRLGYCAPAGTQLSPPMASMTSAADYCRWSAPLFTGVLSGSMSMSLITPISDVPPVYLLKERQHSSYFSRVLFTDDAIITPASRLYRRRPRISLYATPAKFSPSARMAIRVAIE